MMMSETDKEIEEPREGVRDSFFDLSADALAKRIGKRDFFHDMILKNGIRTRSKVYGDALPPNYHLWPVFAYLNEIDLSDAECLDIGTFDGMTAFVLAEAGAKRITATCQHDLKRFRMVRAYQGYENIDYRPGVSLSDFPNLFEAGSFDLVVSSAMMHHLTGPLDAFLEARRLLRRGGLFIVESLILEGDDPSLALNTEIDDPVYGIPTLFVPTVAAIRGMLKLAGFDILSESAIRGGELARETNHGRITVLARASRLSDIGERSEKTIEIHENASKIGSYELDKWECDDEAASSVALWECDDEAASSVAFRGRSGRRNINIWTQRSDTPLCPSSTASTLNKSSRFSLGLESDLLRLARKRPGAEFNWSDIHFLGVRYPGEGMPDGMQWGLKQLGNLFALDKIIQLGLANVLEVGPGFNHYFPNHLPDWCSYTGLDSKGFYDEDLLAIANKSRKKGEFAEGLLGEGKNELAASSFDACVSVSALEHASTEDIETICRDMFRILSPGGWALHSIDFNTAVLPTMFDLWRDAMLAAGFAINPARVETPAIEGLGAKNTVLYEPMSMRARFYGRYKDTIWKKDASASTSGQCATILIAAQKPLSAR